MRRSSGVSLKAPRSEQKAPELSQRRLPNPDGPQHLAASADRRRQPSLEETPDRASVKRTPRSNDSSLPPIRSDPASPRGAAAKISQIISVFQAFDKNKDGSIDLEELERLIWSLNPQFKEKDLEVLFQTLDQNGDGFIQYEEFIKWMYGDDMALARLNVGPKCSRRAQVDVYGPNGALLRLQPSIKDTVRDLRLRACVPLGVPVEGYSSVSVRLKSGAGKLPDSKPLKELQNEELQVIIENRHQLFTASGRRLQVWAADVLETKACIEAPAHVLQVLYMQGNSVLIAAMNGSLIAAWDIETTRLLWQTSVPCAVGALASHRHILFAGIEDGTLLAFDCTSGEHIWYRKVLCEGSLDAIHVLHVVGAHGLICAGTDSGHIYAWEAASGRQLWKARHKADDSHIWHFAGATHSDASHPETLLSGTPCSIVAWDVRRGRQRWRLSDLRQQSIRGLFYHELYDSVSVAIQGDVCTDAESIICSLDGRTGSELSRARMIDVRFLKGRRQYLFSSTDKAVQAWDMLTGNKAWEVQLCEPGPSCIQAFAFAEDLDVIYAASAQGIHALDSKNGSLRGSVELAGGVTVLHYPCVETEFDQRVLQ